ncbi:MAG TPA: penicillin-binding protein, partial [Roseiarcus sp.]|nr:penicillin-binding protein [Roseiarcus sp.]
MIGLGRRRNRERIEPRLDDSGRGRGRFEDLRADPEDNPRRARSSRRGGGARSGGRRRGGGRDKRSGFGRLLYWCFVLGVWGFVGV